MADPTRTSIEIQRPAPRATSEIQVPPKAYLNFTFPLQEAASAKQGDDLVITLKDGAVVICRGYYSNNAEGEGPQIAVNGQALPPSALDMLLKGSEVDGQRLERGTEPVGGENAEEHGDAAGQQAAGAAATGQSGQAGASGNAANAGGTSASDSASSSPSSNASSSSGSSSSSGTKEGGLKLDENVDFLGGIPRLPGLDLGSDRGFERTEIEGGATWSGDDFTAVAPTPPTQEAPLPPLQETPAPPAQETPLPPAPETPLPPPIQFKEIKGLQEQGTNAAGVATTPGKDMQEHSFSLTVPEGMTALEVTLNFSRFPGAATGEFQPDTEYTTTYGKFSYTVTDTLIPVLDANGQPVLDENGVPQTRPGVEITLKYYDLDNNNATINALPEGGTLHENMSFVVTGKGTEGAGSTLGSANIAFVITGSNDGPSLKPGIFADSAGTLAAHAEVKEEGVYNGNESTHQGVWENYNPGTPPADAEYGTHKGETRFFLSATDPDKGDSLTYSLEGVNLATGSVSGGAATLVRTGNGTYTLKIGDEACGTVTINTATGEVSFVLDNSSALIQGMQAGEVNNFTFQAKATDSHGLSSTGNFTLIIHGTNDTPSISLDKSQLTLQAASGSSPSDGGTAQGNDTDQGSTLKYYLLDTDGNRVSSIEDADGTLSINENTGQYTYTIKGDSATVVELNVGDTLIKTAPVTVVDEHGAHSEAQVTVTIKGANEAPSFETTGGGILFKDADGNVQGHAQLKEMGIINGQATTDGDWETYTPGTGSTDPEFTTHKTSTTVYLHGKDVDNKAELNYGLQEGNVTLTANGGATSLTATLVYNAATGSYDLMLGSERAASLVLNPATGKLVFVLNNDASAIQDMNAGESYTLTFTASVTDEHTATSKGDFTLTIHGTDGTTHIDVDVVEFGVASGGNVEFAGTPTANWQISGTGQGEYYILDSNGNPVKEVSTPYGKVTVDANGNCVYTLSNNADAVNTLKLGEKHTESFTVGLKSADGLQDISQTVTVTITGSNDRPDLSIDATGGAQFDDKGNASFTFAESGENTSFNNVSGSMRGEDIDKDAVLTYSIHKTGPIDDSTTTSLTDGDLVQSWTGTYGTLTLDGNGGFTYTENGKVEAGREGIDTFTVVVRDEHGAFSHKQLTFTVTGEDNPPVLSEGIFKSPGTDVLTKAEVKEEGVYGGNQSTTGGIWESYVPGTPSSAPDFGTHKNSVDFYLHSSDADAADAAKPRLYEITGVKLGGTNGQIIAATTAGKTYDVVLNGEVCGWITIDNTTGKVTFDLNNAAATVQRLQAGDKLDLTFSAKVTVNNAASNSVDFNLTIHGTNDQPTLTEITPAAGATTNPANNDALQLAESGSNTAADKHSVSGTLKGNDGDAGDNLTFYVASKTFNTSQTSLNNGDKLPTLNGLYGTLKVNADGSFTYTEKGNVNTGDVLTDKFTVLVVDSKGAFHYKDIYFEVTGADNPPIFGVASGTVKEDGVHDQNTPTNDGGTGNGQHLGTVDIDLTAKVSDPDQNGLQNPSFTLTTGAGSLKGTSIGTTLTVEADGKVMLDGVQIGTLTLTSAGQASFTLLAGFTAIDKLQTGQTATLVFKATVSDANGKSTDGTFEVNIMGTNDKPTLAVTDHTGAASSGSFALTESGYNAFDPTDPLDKHASVSGKLVGSDVDDASFRYSIYKGSYTGSELKLNANDIVQELKGQYGTLIIKTDGSFIYTENGSLKFGDPAGKDTFKVIVRDPAGAFDVKELEFTVTGKDNAVNFAGGKDANYVISLVEQGVYEGNKDNTATDADKDFKAKGTSTGNVKNYEGTSDAFIIDDDKSATLSFALKGKDGTSYPPSGSIQTILTTYGTLTFDTATGDYTFILDETKAQGLKGGETFEERFVLVVTKTVDGVSKDYSCDFTVNISGMNDQPTFTVTGLSINEDVPSVSGSCSAVTDPDQTAGKAHDYDISVNGQPMKIAMGAYGYLTIDKDGNYTYTLDNSLSQSLNHGEVKTEEFIIRVTDDKNAYTEQKLVVTVTGQYDNPTISYATGTVLEDNGVVTTPTGDTISISGKAPTIKSVDTLHASNRTYSLLDGSGNEISIVDGKQTLSTSWGTIVFTVADGTYTYTLNAQTNLDMQGFNEGQAFGQEKFTVKVTFNDYAYNGGKASAKGELVIDLMGANDAPVINDVTSDLTPEIVRKQPYESNPETLGHIWATDVDHTDLSDSGGTGANTQLRFGFAITVAGKTQYVQNWVTSFGSVYIDAITGEYTYTLDNSNSEVQGLLFGQSKTDSFTVVVRDPMGATDEVTVNVTIKGINPGTGGSDSYQLPDVPLDVSEDTDLKDTSGPGTGPAAGAVVRYCFRVSDGQGGYKMVQSLESADKYGSIYINAYTGEYRYVLNNEYIGVQALALGQFVLEKYDVYTFTVKDGKVEWLNKDSAAGTIKVTIHGDNDAPELEHAVTAPSLKIFAGANGSTRGDFDASDVDITDVPLLRFGFDSTYNATETIITKNFTNTEGGIVGTVTLNTLTGEYVYTYKGGIFTTPFTVTFTVFVNDHNGKSDSKEVTLTVTPDNAAPVIVSHTVGGDTSYAYSSDYMDRLDVDSSNGHILLDGQDLTPGLSSALTSSMQENSKTALEGKLGAWDYEVDHVPGATGGYKFFICESDGSKLGNVSTKYQDYGTLIMKEDGTYTFTLNSNNPTVQKMQEGDAETLTFYVAVRDAGNLLSQPQELQIVIKGTNNAPILEVAAQAIVLWEDGSFDPGMNGAASTTPLTLKLTDPDLVQANAITAAKGFHFSAEKGTNGETLDGTRSYDAANKIYSYETEFGTLKVNATDVNDIKYWFEVNKGNVSYLEAGQNLNLKFTITFNDGQVENVLSNQGSVNISIKGQAGSRALALAFEHDEAAMAHAMADAGNTTADAPQSAQPLSLQTPLPDMPPDMTSSAGQDSLHFQLQTTGV